MADFLAQGRAINNDAVNVYLPSLRITLTAELHFVKKVCSPNNDQFNDIHRAGLGAILETAHTFAELKRKRAKLETWPDPSEAITAALQEAVGRLLSVDVAETYRTEIAARVEAHRAADAATVVTMIDRQALLDPDQQQAIFWAIRNNWKPHWSSANVVFLYPQYATLPESDVLSPHLSDPQQRLCSYLPKPRNGSLLWQLYFGVHDIFGVKGLESFADPDSPVDIAEQE